MKRVRGARKELGLERVTQPGRAKAVQPKLESQLPFLWILTVGRQWFPRSPPGLVGGREERARAKSTWAENSAVATFDEE
jgi:hypothetical protein